MKLDELTPSVRKSLKGKSRLGVVQLMADHGYTEIGIGATSEVMSFGKKDKVVKVFSLDMGYMEWVGFCKQNAGNPYLPVFRSNVLRVADGVNMISIEKLSELRDGTPANLIKSVVLFYDYLSYDHDAYRSEFSTNTFGTKIISPEQFQRVFTDNDLMQVIRFLIKHKDRLDMHQWNVMGRGNQLVVVDPLR